MSVSVFYHVSQVSDSWNQDHYQRQIQLLESSGLYSQIQSMHLHVTDVREHLATVPDRTTEIHYHRHDQDPQIEIMRSLQDFARENPYNKILFMHCDHVSQQKNSLTENRAKWTEFLELCTIKMWHKCLGLLDFYDTVGADYVNYAVFGDDIKIWAPHYPGMFWWATGHYIRKLDPVYLDQDVAWRSYLPELWIGSAHPRGFMMMQTNSNPFFDRVQYDPERIEDGVARHLEMLKNPANRY